MRPDRRHARPIDEPNWLAKLQKIAIFGRFYADISQLYTFPGRKAFSISKQLFLMFFEAAGVKYAAKRTEFTFFLFKSL